MAYIVTGHKGVDHITSDDMSALQQGIVGTDDYLLSDTPDEFVATINADGSISLAQGEIITQGVHSRVESGDTVAVESGSTGSIRLDCIIGIYTNNNGIENFEIGVKKGTSSNYPELLKQDIRNGGTIREVALFSVKLEGTQISEIKRVIPSVNSLSTIAENVREASSNASKEVNALRTSVNTSVNNLQKNIDTVKTNKTFASEVVVYHQSLSIANNEYSDTRFWSFNSSINSKTGKKDVTGAAIVLRDAEKNEKCSFRYYSNGAMAVIVGNQTYNIQFAQRGYVETTPTTVASVNAGMVTVDGKNYTVKREYYTKTITVTFPKAFTSVPAVAVGCHSVAFTCSVNNVSKTGFSITVRSEGKSLAGIDWIALGYIS